MPRSAMSSRQVPEVLRVPTFKAVAPRAIEIDVSKLDEAELRTLKKKDPFLYHSIPAVHKATLSLNDVDCANIKSQPEDAPKACSAKVLRKTRLSTESHMSVLLEDLIYNDELFRAEFQEHEEDTEDLESVLNGLLRGRGPSSANDRGQPERQ